jgi:hypothetical protein
MWWRRKPTNSERRVGNLARNVRSTARRLMLANYGNQPQYPQNTPSAERARGRVQTASRRHSTARTQYYAATKPKSQ